MINTNENIGTWGYGRGGLDVTLWRWHSTKRGRRDIISKSLRRAIKTFRQQLHVLYNRYRTVPGYPTSQLRTVKICTVHSDWTYIPIISGYTTGYHTFFKITNTCAEFALNSSTYRYHCTTCDRRKTWPHQLEKYDCIQLIFTKSNFVTICIKIL
jgi:hypothetical protein